MIPEPLPEGYRFKATGSAGNTWIVKAPRVTFETPDGPIEMGVMDGQPFVRTFNMQGRAGFGGPDNTVLFLFGQPKE
jgi:hypothetical protein